MDDKERALFERSVIALEKMAHKVRRPRSDVERLNVHFEPYESEPGFPVEPWPWKPLKSFRDVLETFEKAWQEFELSERIISQVGARVDQIRDDAWSRDELKLWIRGGSGKISPSRSEAETKREWTRYSNFWNGTGSGFSHWR